MNVVRWDPTHDLSLNGGDVHRLLGRFIEAASERAPDRWIPPIDVAEAAEHFIVTMDAPGLTGDDVTIEVHERTLRISGERRQQRTDEHASYFRMERGYGSFARSFTLPRGIDVDAIEATFDLGVLELRIPKPVEPKPHRIEIGSTSVPGAEQATDASPPPRGRPKERVLANA